MISESPDPFFYAFVLFSTALLPFLVVMLTSYTKIIIVLYIIRNAIGLQQAPANMVLNSIAIILTVYIMSPVISESVSIFTQKPREVQSVEAVLETWDQVTKPYKTFLHKFSTSKERAFFVEATANVWPAAANHAVDESSLSVLVPAFLVSEITRGFKIGFMVYLPFIVIDLIVANVLLSLGMIMLSPLVISLPFKLFLFVAIDGWVKLLHGLVLSYSI